MSLLAQSTQHDDEEHDDLASAHGCIVWPIVMVGVWILAIIIAWHLFR